MARTCSSFCITQPTRRCHPGSPAPLSRAELAPRVGVPVSTLRHWEGDRGLPGLPVLLRLAQTLGVPVERFAEGVEDPAREE
jgi:transcriptional regulator with XRE-family HTH domain